MKFKKDWSLAYFLFYMCQISYWLILIGVGVEVFISIGHLADEKVIVREIPVNMELKQFDSYNDIELTNTYINIPERVNSELHISGDYNDIKSAFFLFNGLRLYENAVFFLLFFIFAKVLKNVAEGAPFHTENASHLSVIGLTLLISGGVNLAFQFLNAGHFIQLPILNNLNFPDGITVTSIDMFGKDFIIAGIFFVVLGYVFKEGTRIYEEQKLTV